MSKFLKKAAGKLEDYAAARTGGGGGASSTSAPPSTPLDAPPSRRDVYAHRQQRGVNLGSLFALEPWLTPSLFEGVANANSEMDLLRALPAEEARGRLERHWGGFIDAGDWRWMAAHGINTVRLPLLYVHFCASQAPHLLEHTEYAPYADVYAGAWAHVERILAQAAEHRIGVLVDLHGAPGAQNADGHSGLSGGKVGLWDGRAAAQNQARTVDILVALARALAPHEHVVGLELLNEPRNGGALQGFYERAAGAIRGAGVHMPLYLGDGWDAPHYAKLVAARQDFCVLDTHVYRCFTPDDHGQSAAQHARSMRPGGASHGSLAAWGDAAKRSAVVGEWSAALNPASLRGCGDTQAAQREYARAQLALFEQTCGGAFFWTLKKEGSADPGWCLYTAVEQGVLPASLNPYATAPSDDAMSQARRAAHDAHCKYWAAHGAAGAHESFAEGFAQATRDAAAFWQQDKSCIGFAEQWARSRTRAYEAARGSRNEWEYAHGFAQGIGAFNGALAQ